MQEVKNNLKKIGEKMQGSNSAHQESLRQKLFALHKEEPALLPRRFAWFPVLSWGAVAVVALVIGNAMHDRSAAIPEYQQSVTEFHTTEDSLVNALSDSTGLAGGGSFFDDYDGANDVRPIEISANTAKDEDIVEYEEDNGAMLEQSVNISMLTQEDDASETVAALFVSLGGHLSSIRSNDDKYATITGSIPASHMSLFYEQLDALVKNDAFMEKTLRGDSVTSEALDLAERQQALRDAEADITEQLQNATTDEQKKILRESLETISDEMIQLTDEQDALEDRVEYVTVSVRIEKLPSIWSVQNEYQLNDVIAGYESPTLWQGIIINVLTVFFIAIEFLSATFWVLIPLGMFIIVRLRRRRMFRELD